MLAQHTRTHTPRRRFILVTCPKSCTNRYVSPRHLGVVWSALLGFKSGRKFIWHQVVQRAVRPFPVVKASVSFDEHRSFQQVAEQFSIEQLVSESTVETLA